MTQKTIEGGRHLTGPLEDEIQEVERLRKQAGRKLEKATIIEGGGMDSFMLYLPRDLKERLRGIALDEGKSMAEIVTALLDANLPLNK